MPGGGIVASFEPGEHDVVSTKLRSWNLGHPGNLAYADLLVDYALKLPPTSTPNYSSILNDTTKQLVEFITVEKGGRFLKIQEGEVHPSECILMDYKASHHKVLHGLKNKQKVILTKGIPPKPTKVTKPPTKNEHFKVTTPRSRARPKSPKVDATVRTTGRTRKRRKFDDEEEVPVQELELQTPKKRRRKRVTSYQAQQRPDGSINPYALELISHVCNHQSVPILERPGVKYSNPEEEPDKEREIRLQLRHRFFSAIAVKMPIVEFAKKLMEVWGGSLTVTSELIHRSELGGEQSEDAHSPGSRSQGTGNIASSKSQSTGELQRRHSSDESAAEASPRRMPQKQPRKMSFTINPQFASSTAQSGWGNDTGATSQDNGASSSDDDSDCSSSGEGSDSDSEEGQQTPAYTSPYGFGYYGMGPPQAGEQEKGESSVEGSAESDGEGSMQQYKQTHDYIHPQYAEADQDPSESSTANHDTLHVLSAAANYELKSMKVEVDGQNDTT